MKAVIIQDRTRQDIERGSQRRVITGYSKYVSWKRKETKKKKGRQTDRQIESQTDRRTDRCIDIKR